MSIQILRLSAVLYAVAATLYLVHFARPRHQKLVWVAAGVLAAAFGVHAVAIGLGCKEFGGAEFLTLRGGFVMLAWLVAGAYLILHRIYRIPTVGAFVTPIVLVALIPTLFGAPGRPEAIPKALREKWLPFHVGAAFLGIALFAIAFGVALMYLLQEREVKGKRFGALFSRLPSLDTLDRLNQRLVRYGFVIFTVALVSGSLVAKKAWGSFWEWDPQQVSSLIVWTLYGGLVQLRHTGWHGRRYALLTMIGFAIVMVSFIGLGILPVGRHQGQYS